MKSRPPLVLMEQLVMLLVFALAAALCLQAFVKSDGLSRRVEARDCAAALCQSVAEVVRQKGGVEAGLVQVYGQASWQDGAYVCFYDEDWDYICSEPDGGTGAADCVYRLAVYPVDTEAAGLGKARLEAVSIREEAALFTLEVAWQEVIGHAG